MAEKQIDTQAMAGKVITLGTERLFGQDEVLELYGLAMAMKTVGVVLAKDDLAAENKVGSAYLFGSLATRAEDLHLVLEPHLHPDEISLLIDAGAALRLMAEHLDSASNSTGNLNGISVLVNSLSQRIFNLGEELDNRTPSEIQ